MGSLFWHLTNRTAETLLILNLFHLLLAGLTLLVLLHQLRANRAAIGRPDRLLTFGFSLLVLHFAVLTLHYGVAFFMRQQLALAGVERISHGLLVAGVLVVVAAYVDSTGSRRLDWVLPAFIILLLMVLLDLSLGSPPMTPGQRPHSLAMLVSDLLGLLAVLLGILVVGRGECRWEGRRARLWALASLALVFVLHSAPSLAPSPLGIYLWNTEEQILSLALFGFTWAAGERSQNLLDRVFVRLNLTFIVLASLIMLITAGMEKYQYFRLAEERSTNLAEFLRGHVVYYGNQGENLDQILAHPEVLRRVVAEFGTLPELRVVSVHRQGQRAAFRYTKDWEVKESLTSETAAVPAENDPELRNSFPMIRLPIEEGAHSTDWIEFTGTMDYVNDYIGKYIIVIYCSFTVVVALATLIIGIIVADTDRQLRRQYAELQEAQQHLAQSAKLASIGELAGGMAHEINTPITSILALASHMAGGDKEGALAAKERKNLGLIVKQAERVAALVGGLLSFSRQSKLHMTQVNVRELLDTALELIEFRLKGSQVEMQRQVDSELPAVRGDTSRLTEVFVNLFNNALDAMPGGGRLSVRAMANRPDGGVRIEVEDTGEGIPSEDLPRIFDPFFTTKRPGKGTGLGLSISHGIIKDHGGEIWARSKPGAGTTMVVTLFGGGTA